MTNSDDSAWKWIVNIEIFLSIVFTKCAYVCYCYVISVYYSHGSIIPGMSLEHDITI